MSSPEPSGPRRDRNQVAAQACQTCRTRKSKCDEARPACGLCRRLKLECVYREPPPTKKDKTMVHILDSLARLELKMDHAISGGGAVSPGNDHSHFQSQSDSFTTQGPARGHREAYEHVTAPHKVILWPSIYIFLANTGNSAAAESQNILQQGTAWFLQQERAFQEFGLRTDVSASDAADQLLFRSEELCAAYFDNFNILAPILDKDRFIREVMNPALGNRCQGQDEGTVLTWLVLALGDVAIQGVFGDPMSQTKDVASGLRGGTPDKPPGLEYFNEARRRFGFIFTQISIEAVQIMLLMATYYETSARHLDFWKCAVSASVTCQALIRGQRVEWETPYGHCLKRTYWVCMLNEMFYHHDLDFPQSGIEELQDLVPSPSYYNAAQGLAPVAASDDRAEFHHHFLAMVTLRQLIARIHDAFHRSADKEISLGQGNSNRFVLVREMAHQLESWRNLLPRALQWQDTDRFAFPPLGPSNRLPNDPLFTATQLPILIAHRHNIDIMVAQLRTRYYYARFMIYRPFIWRALHMCEAMTEEDEECCAMAIRSAIMWPVTMSPPRSKKRLVPHHFTWTQNLIGILLILRMRHENDCLARICAERVNPEEISRSVGLMLDWIRDMRQVDGIANWGWTVLEPLYRNV